jgi:hypothetical protein
MEEKITAMEAIRNEKKYRKEPFARLGFLFKNKACEKFYNRRPVGSALGA